MGNGNVSHPNRGDESEEIQDRVRPEARENEQRTDPRFVGGTTAEAIGGLAAAVLAFVGLRTMWSYTLGGVATIAIGLGLLAHGSAIASRWRQAMRRLDRDRFDRTELAGGITIEILGGVAGLVLGAAALANVAPFVTLPAAAIVFGVTLLLAGATQPALLDLVPEPDRRVAELTHDASFASGGVMVIVGIAAAVLGILALIHVGTTVTLSLVAMLCVGVGLFLAASAVAARVMHRFARSGYKVT
jgi:hypothetical protein